MKFGAFFIIKRNASLSVFIKNLSEVLNNLSEDHNWDSEVYKILSETSITHSEVTIRESEEFIRHSEDSIRRSEAPIRPLLLVRMPCFIERSIKMGKMNKITVCKFVTIILYIWKNI